MYLITDETNGDELFKESNLFAFYLDKCCASGCVSGNIFMSEDILNLRKGVSITKIIESYDFDIKEELN